MLRCQLRRENRMIRRRVAAQIQHPVPASFKNRVWRQGRQEMQVGYADPHYRGLRESRKGKGCPQAFFRKSAEQQIRLLPPIVPFEPDTHGNLSLVRGAREEQPGGLRLPLLGDRLNLLLWETCERMQRRAAEIHSAGRVAQPYQCQLKTIPGSNLPK